MNSTCHLILATPQGICRLSLHGERSIGPLERPLDGEQIEAVVRDRAGTIYAGSDAGKIFRSEDSGSKWDLIFHSFPSANRLWALAAHPVRPQEIYAGLEPASLWISRNGGEYWDELVGLRDHPAAEQWHFFEPMLPHVRAIAFDAKGEQIYVGIEEGGILLSRDGGGSFENKSKGVNEDIHFLKSVPDEPDHLFALTGGGLFRSRDGGHRWVKVTRGLHRWYLIPLHFVGNSPGVLCLGAGNTSPSAWKTRGADAALYRSDDGGESWGLAEGPFPLRGMPTSIVADISDPDRLFAGTTDGVLLRSDNGGKRWEIAAEKLPRIEEMVILQG